MTSVVGSERLDSDVTSHRTLVGVRVKDLAELAGTTVRTVRYYHQLGLLAVPESGTTWRSYGFAHLTRLMRVRWLVESGVPLAEVPHMLRPPAGANERTVVVDDLDGVLRSIDDKMAVLTAQRAQVATLLERVRVHGWLSPLPPPIVRLYAALRSRDLPPAMAQAIERERELAELACYRGALPADLLTLVDAMREEDVDEVCRLWQECHDVDERTAGRHLAPGDEAMVDDIVREIVDLAHELASEPTDRLLDRAAQLSRPPIRAAIDLAYPSPVYRRVVTRLVAVAAERSHA